MVSCDFCGKSEDKIKKMIVGNRGVGICNECVFLCTELLLKEIKDGYKEIDFDKEVENK